MTHGGGCTFSQNVSPPALPVWDRQCLEDSERKDDLMNELLNDKAVYRTATATPGLLKRTYYFKTQIIVQLFKNQNKVYFL